MKRYKYLIMAESYDENVGGCVVLHKLCDEINKMGHQAYLVPAYRTYFFDRNNLIRPVLRFAKEFMRRSLPFRTNPAWITPVYSFSDGGKNLADAVAIYPETISGNPLRATKVVRWFLHHPGFHEPEYYYGPNEIYFRYHSGIQVPKNLRSNLSDLELRIVSYPLEIYNTNDATNIRDITTYAIRKGVGKRLVHDLSGSVLIDGLSHREVARLFKRSKTFISYDPYTAYSTFAALCGCDSVVIPDEGVSIEQWVPDQSHRAGIAYGFEGIGRSRAERTVLIERVNSEIYANSKIVETFLSMTEEFFGREH